MHQTAKKSSRVTRVWNWFGNAKDSGRVPLDGGVHRASNRTQINDNECYSMSAMEYKRGNDFPTKEPGYRRLSKVDLGSPAGAVSDFRDSSGTNHLVIYHDGYLYEVNESTGALTKQNTTQFPAGSIVSNDGSDYQCIVAHTSSATDEPGTGVNWATYWVLIGTSAAYTAWALSTAYTIATHNQGATLEQHGDSLIIAFGGHLYEWTGSGAPTVLSNSPDGADWVKQFENRLYSNSTTAAVMRASNALYANRNTWQAAYAFNLGRTGEELNGAIQHDDFLLVFQDNQVSAWNPAAVIDASTIDTWSDTLGSPGRYSFVKCGDFGTAYYTTEGIKFISKWSLTPIVISNKIAQDLDAIPAAMRTKVALGWHDGRLRVAYADESNSGTNNREFVCHLENAIVSGSGAKDAAWTGPTNRDITFYYTRLSNSGVKNELLWADSYGIVYKRSDGVYSSENSSGTTADMSGVTVTKAVQLAGVGTRFWPKEVLIECEGSGTITVRARLDSNADRQIGTMTATTPAGEFPLTFPITLAEEASYNRQKRMYWPTSGTQYGAYLTLEITESSDNSFSLLKIGVLGDSDGSVKWTE